MIAPAAVPPDDVPDPASVVDDDQLRVSMQTGPAESSSWPIEHLRSELVRLGLVSATTRLSTRPLSGGVSNDVVAVRGEGIDLVLKRALPRLRVEQEWLAEPERILAEADALRIAGALELTLVPPLVAVDTRNHVVAIGRAPDSYGDWRTPLLAGNVDQRVAEMLGDALARFHAGTWGQADFPDRLRSTRTLDQLRIDPFYRSVVRYHPDLETIIVDAATTLLTPQCLVHGDFSPKNVLTDGTGLWLIDWEAAHLGNAAFDVAFLLSHLFCKTLHGPDSHPEYRAAGEAFLTAYQGRLASVTNGIDEPLIATHIGCLILARIDGKSPAPYLSAAARDVGRAFARAALQARVTRIGELWDRAANL